MESLKFSPIGFFKGTHKNKYDAPRQSVEDSLSASGEVHLEKGLNLEQALKGIEGFERIWLIYQFHLNENWKPLTETPRATEKQGVFATRSPYRPNPIGMSCVKLISAEKNILKVEGYDLLDGTPILDIKPYIPSCDQFDVKNESWLEEGELTEVVFSKEALSQISWLEERGVSSLRMFILDQLKRDPLNAKKKRLTKLEKENYCLSYRTWRVHFTYEAFNNVCNVLFIKSGYSEGDLKDSVDKYGDKKLHKDYLSLNRDFL